MTEYECKAPGTGESKTLPAGAYIKPIDLKYVSEITREKWKSFSPDLEVFCYTAFGFLPIPKKLVRIR